jgi:hypothetical protein
MAPRRTFVGLALIAGLGSSLAPAPLCGAHVSIHGTAHEEIIMLNFLATYWIWILLIGGMLVMHRAHGGHGAGGHGGANAGGCGGGHAAHDHTAEHPASHPRRGPVPLDKPPTA